MGDILHSNKNKGEGAIAKGSIETLEMLRIFLVSVVKIIMNICILSNCIF